MNTHHNMTAQLAKLPPLSEEQYQAFWKVSVMLNWAQPRLSGTESKILQMIVSCSYGEGREFARLSIDDFVDGYDDSRGWQGGSGLSKASIQRGLASLLELGVIWRSRAHGRQAFHYKINVYALLSLADVQP